MRVYYKSYLEFLLKADLLTRELTLNPKDAAELLARVSGYNNHCTMPVGQECTGPSPSCENLIIRLLALRPDISPKRARDIITRLDLLSPFSTPAPASASVSQQTDATRDSTGSRLH
jgi:hypothetical protein